MAKKIPLNLLTKNPNKNDVKPPVSKVIAISKKASCILRKL